MKKLFSEWKWFGVGLIVVLALGFLLRIYHLTLLPVFVDEAIYIRWSQIMSSEPTLRFLPLSDGKQPLFMWVLMFVVRRLSDPLFVGRSISVVAGLGTMIGIVVVSLALFKSRRAALVAGLLWAISPFALFFDRMALVDSMLACWVIWTLFFGILMARTRRFDMAMLAGFFLGLAGLTKSSAIFAAALLPLVWILGEWKVKKGLWERIFWALFLTLTSWGIAGGMYNIQRLGPNFHLLASRTKDYVFPVSHLWEKPMDPLVPFFDRAMEWLVIMGPSMLVILALFGFFGDKKYGKEKLLLLAWFLGPLVVQAALAKTFTARYVLFALPPLFALAGASVRNVSRKWAAIGLGLGFFVIQSVVFDYRLLMNLEAASLPRSERSGYLEEWTAGTGIKEASELIRAEALGSDGQIVVGTEGYFGTLPDGLQMYLDGVSKVTVIGIGLGIKEAPVQLLEARKAGSRAFLLANTSRLFFEKLPEELGLRLLGQWAKAKRPEGIKENFVYGERDYLQLWEVIR